MADQQEPVRLRITNTAEVAQIIPYLVGFTPEESLVIVASQQGRVQVTARVDLQDVRSPGSAEDLLDRIWARFPDASASVAAYTTDHRTGWSLLQRCDDWLPFGCQTMLVDGDTWHMADGTTGIIDRYGPLAAQATYHGLQHLQSRADLKARFTSAPDSDELDQQLGDALANLPAPDQAGRVLELTRELIERNLPSATPAGHATTKPGMSATDAIQLSILAQHPAARDLALFSISQSNATDHLRLWQNVVRATPAASADMPLYLAGMAAWLSGDGASATIALERALNTAPPSSEPHPLRLLEGIIDQVVPPGAWESMRPAILADAHPELRRALRVDGESASPRHGWPPVAAAASPRHRPEPDRLKPPAPGIAL